MRENEKHIGRFKETASFTYFRITILRTKAETKVTDSLSDFEESIIMNNMPHIYTQFLSRRSDL